MSETQETRECGTCRLCCKTMGIYELDKSPCSWCEHANPKGGAGCNIYEQRPRTCQDFRCLWLEGGMDEELQPHLVKSVVSVNQLSPHVHPFEQGLMVHVQDEGDPKKMVTNSKLSRWLRGRCHDGLIVGVINKDRLLRIFYPDVACQEIQLPPWSEEMDKFELTGEPHFQVDMRPFSDWAGWGCNKFTWKTDPETGAKVREELTYFDKFANHVSAIEAQEDAN